MFEQLFIRTRFSFASCRTLKQLFVWTQCLHACCPKLEQLFRWEWTSSSSEFLREKMEYSFTEGVSVSFFAFAVNTQGKRFFFLSKLEFALAPPPRLRAVPRALSPVLFCFETWSCVLYCVHRQTLCAT